MDYVPEKYYGEFSPLKPKRTFREKLFKQQIDLVRVRRNDGEKITSFEIFIPELSLEFPKPSIFLYLYGFKSNSFVRLSFVDFRNMVAALEECSLELSRIQPEIEKQSIEYEVKSKEIEIQRQTAANQLEQLKLMARLSKNNQLMQDGYEDTDFIPPGQDDV